MSLLIKVCGLKTPESVECAVEVGTDMIGLNFHPRSPRYVAPETASNLAAAARGRAEIVALIVDAEQSEILRLKDALAPDLWQCHGRETVQRIADLTRETGLPAVKAIGVAEREDLDAIPAFFAAKCRILVDAKPPKDAAYPGGHGRVFDWSILSALPPDMPFMLSGGLTPENVGAAIRFVRGMGLNLIGVDVASGVENAPGVKDLGKIRAFVAAAREADGVTR